MTEERLRQAIRLVGERENHQSQIECIKHFNLSIPEADKEDPWDDIDIIFSGPDKSITLGDIPSQLKTHILELVKKYHRNEIDSINEQIKQL